MDGMGVGVGHILAQRVSVRDGDRSLVEVGNEMLMRPLCQKSLKVGGEVSTACHIMFDMCSIPIHICCLARTQLI